MGQQVETITSMARTEGPRVHIVSESAYKGLTGRVKRTLSNGLIQVAFDPQQMYVREGKTFTTHTTMMGYFDPFEVENIDDTHV